MRRLTNMYHKNGLHFGGKNPIASASVFKRVIIPSSLYGCKHWELLPANEIETLEATVRYFSRKVQGLPRTSPLCCNQ